MNVAGQGRSVPSVPSSAINTNTRHASIAALPSRRGGRGGRGSVRRATSVANAPRTQFLSEFRAHEEDMAARVIQRASRGFLGRRFVASLLTQLYEKQYDPVAKVYYYVNTQTNESSWEKPKALQLFMAADKDVRARQITLTPHEAAKRIQRLVRRHQALRAIKAMVRENYMKLFDERTRSFYYLNTRTGAVSEHKPVFLRADDEDLEIEQFHFRKAVCKISTSSNLYGSGVVGTFCGTLCVLTDGKTLPDQDTARAAHVVCNYAAGRIPFTVLLAPERFYVGLYVHEKAQGAGTTAKKYFDFVLCAVNEEQFTMVAGDNVVPLKLEMNDRKMGCATEGFRVGDYIELVGFPHGKMQVVHERRLTRLVPSSIQPARLEFSAPMESGASGSAIFTRGGMLLGALQYAPLKSPPSDCWYIKTILDAATELVTPAQPFLLAATISSKEVQVYWQMVRWYKPLERMDVVFEVEIARHDGRDEIHHEKFKAVYRGQGRTCHVGDLESDTMYSVRCRSANDMQHSAWSVPLRFATQPTPSMAWRLKQCKSMTESITRIRDNPHDSSVHFRAVQWIFAQVEQATSASRLERYEEELYGCQGLALLFETMSRFAVFHDNLLLSVRLLGRLARMKTLTQRYLTNLSRMHSICRLMEHHLPPPLNRVHAEAPSEEAETSTDGKAADQPTDALGDSATAFSKSTPDLQVAIASIALLSFVVDTNDSAKQLLVVGEAIPLVLMILKTFLDGETLLVAECSYLLGVFSHQNSPGCWEIVQAGGLEIMNNVLDSYMEQTKIQYWILVTIGNIAYTCDTPEQQDFLECESHRLLLIDMICRCRIQFLVRQNELELDLTHERQRLEHLQATHIGEEMRNELDACEMTVLAIEAVLAEVGSHNVAETADYALRYLMTPEQARVQAASKRLMKKVLLRKLAMAHQKWVEVTIFERHCSIFRKFLRAVHDRQLIAAFRRWEAVVCEMRKHKTWSQAIGSGLAIDLNKKKRERYRMLVLQK
ncbi:TPA: hypothetical protein N0F65_003736 [Lagenidium giganteum]|uniref:Fibronectin type-III domain-containing protein n=1 Tax=Lagenidium giganteum TaxID=4803 RepID=A0AAV2Z368_9STRA|nr:TPA: hypothetical protein N0F65_003736 [Lagenidium giganteum]